MTTHTDDRAPRTRDALTDVLADLAVLAGRAGLSMAAVAGSDVDRTLHIEVATSRDVARWVTALMIDRPCRDDCEPVPGTRRTVLVVKMRGWTVHLFNITTTPEVAA